MLMLLLYLMVPPTHGDLCTSADIDLDAYRYEEQIPHCKRNVTTERKIAICKRDGVVDRSEFTVDHIIPLSIGGSNRDENLWCQHKSLAVTSLETALFEKLNKGEITQKEAIEQILEAKFEKE